MSELFTLDTLQEFWAKRPKGAKLQVKNEVTGQWLFVLNISPDQLSTPDEWRWEPQSKTVDLSSLAGSNVLCEFGHGIRRFGFLKEVINAAGFIDQDHSPWPQCKPVMNKWMAVSESVVIPDGLDYEWEVTGADHIKIVKFVGLKEGYHWYGEDK